jgi:hypothetical protein
LWGYFSSGRSVESETENKGEKKNKDMSLEKEKQNLFPALLFKSLNVYHSFSSFITG